MPTVPVTAPGWRMEPPVSVPNASGASKAATAAAEPPPEPPGIRSRSQGLRVGPNAECSVDEPIANSSMLVLPSGTRCASRSLRTTVASYGGTQPSRIFEPDVDGMSYVHSTSLIAIGTGERAEPLTCRASGIHCVGRRESALGRHVQERVHVGVDGLDALEVCTRRLDAGDLGCLQLAREFGCAEPRQVAHQASSSRI